MLVVDDDAHFRQALADILTRGGFEPIEAETAEQALDKVERRLPALILLDVNLPGMPGYELLHELREQYGDSLPIVFVSGDRTEPYDRVAGLLLGADDYLVKPVDPAELLARVRRLITAATRRESSSEPPSASDSLTRREREVLGLLAAGLESHAIAAELCIATKTVATHVQRILGKLNVHNRAQAVALAHREGIVAEVGDDGPKNGRPHAAANARLA